MENILYIRVDGNEQIGTGHIMRCLAIAETLRRNKTDVVFIVADTRSESLILNKGFKTIFILFHYAVPSCLCTQQFFSVSQNFLELILTDVH